MSETGTPSYPRLMERRYLALIFVVAFVILSAVAFSICYRHHTINTEQVLKEDRSAANLFSLLLDEHFKKIVSVMEAYIHRPLLLQAVRNKNAEKALVHLISLTKSDPDIDILVISDRWGALWAAYPERPEVLGKNLAYRAWYRGVSKEWKPYISDVVQRIVAEKDSAIQIGIPMFDEAGEVIGILVNTQRTVGLSDLFQETPLDPGQDITVTDRKGQIVYSSRRDLEKEPRPYPFHSGIQKAMAAKDRTFAVDDPDIGGGARYISFSPVANLGWNVSVERDKRSILLSGSSYYIQVTVIAFLLFLSIILLLIYSRKQVMAQQLLEQLKAEKELRVSEERHKSYVEIIMQLSWTTNDQGAIVEDNPSWSEYTGRDYEAYKGFGWIEDIHPDDRERTGQIWGKALAGKSFYETEYRVRRYDGVYRDYLARGIPLLAENGSVREWVGACIDITDRKRMEETLIALSSRQEAILSAVPEMIMEVDNNKIYTWANSAGIEFFGEDVLGKEAAFYFEGEQDTYDTVRPLFNGTEDVIYVESWQRRRDGGKRLLAWWCRVLKDKDGNVTGVLSSAHDITDRKQTEEQLHRRGRLLAAINDVFLETLTADSNEAVASTCLKVAQEITGSKFGFLGEITPQGLYSTSALSDPGWEACRIPETQAEVLIKDMVIRGIWGQVILKKQSLIVNDPASCPDRVGVPEGHPPLTSFLGVPLMDQRKVIGMIAMANRESGYTADQLQDLEALSVAFVEAIRRKQAEEEIKKLNIELERRVIDRTAQLEASNREMESFSYSVSHDLRAPLRSIDGFSKALLDDYQNKLDDTGKTYLERVRRATQHMGKLIDDLLKLSRVTQIAFKLDAVDLSGTIREIAEAHQKKDPDRAVDVIVREGIMVQGDPYLIKVAMENLVDNAFKFTGKEAHPRIEFGVTVRDGKKACFIRDNGVGFDMAYAGKLFGAFQRLHTTDEFPGTGIGLATVQRIIHHHGGHIWAEGETGKGATFYFTID